MKKLNFKNLNNNNVKYILLLAITILFKTIPHLPNFSPALTFSMYFLMCYKKQIATLGIIAMWLLSDISYAVLYHLPMFGDWMIGTYSALCLLILFSLVRPIRPSKYSLFIAAILGASFFWLWTNLTVWLFSGMYTHTFLGFINCYILALPFLTYAILAAVFWSVVLIVGTVFIPSVKNSQSRHVYSYF